MSGSSELVRTSAPIRAEVTPSSGWLDGVNVVDLSTFGPGARCSRALADYGARVVRVAAPGGPRPEPWAYGGGRGGEQVELDVKPPAGRDRFLVLAADADVVIESFRPGVVDQLGIGYDAVRAVNPAVVYCSTTGYGQSGPRSQWAGHDLNYLAVGGYLHCSGRDGDGVPALPGATVADIAGGGMRAAMSILSALLQRERTGQGAYLDVSVTDGVEWMQSLYVEEHLATGADPGPGHHVLTGRYACYGIYRCRDGGFVSVAAIEPRFFANLCNAVGLARWTRVQYDDAAQDDLRAELRRMFATRTRDEWVAELAPADCCVAPVLTIKEVAAERG
ncbi:MAG: CaiB/BaiF CoA transferase family protein [Acidimicrobiales bacterium]